MPHAIKLLSAACVLIMGLAALAVAQSGPSPALMILDVDPDGDVVADTSDSAVLFDAPLPFGDDGVVGMRISEIIVGVPLFSPIEGLPDIAWKDKNCAGCHHWDRENLCTQGKTYLTPAGSEALVKQHPMGGTFKQNLRNWAQGGCQ